MSKAAQTLFVSQPTLSVTMSRLEESLGFSLFVRQKGKLTLTEEGKQFLVCVNRVLDDLDSTVSTLRLSAHAQEESIRVASSLNDLLGAVMSLHYDDMEHLRISQRYSDNDCIAELIRTRKADWGIIFGSAGTEQLKLTPLHQCPRIFVMRADHPLLQYDKLPLSELASQSFICNRSRDDQETLTTLSRKYHFTPQIDSECDDPLLEMHILNSTDYISLMPAVNLVKLLRSNPKKPLRYLYADFEVPPTQIYIISLHESKLSSYSLRLIDYIRLFLQEESGKITAFLERGEVIP